MDRHQVVNQPATATASDETEPLLRGRSRRTRSPSHRQDAGGGGQSPQTGQDPGNRYSLLATAKAAAPTTTSPAATAPASSRLHHGRGRALVNLLSAIMFLTACSAGFLILPHVRILEDILCRDYYGNHQESQPGGAGGGAAAAAATPPPPIDELLCKVEPVQTRLTSLIGLKAGLEALAAFVAAFPWGLAADRIGRKPVFALCLTGMIINALWVTLVMWFHEVFPVRLIILGSAGPFLGGGDAVMIGVVLSMIADATTDAERSLGFLRVHVATMCGFLLSPTLSSLMMERTGTPWYNLIVGCGLLVLGAASISLAPETLRWSKGEDKDTDKHRGRGAGGEGEEEEEEERDQDCGNDDDDDDDDTTLHNPVTITTAIRKHITHMHNQLTSSLAILQSPSLILLLCVCFLYMPVLNSTVQFMPQFVSTRYGITIARTGYIQTLYGLVQIVQSLVVLPWVMRKTSVVVVVVVGGEGVDDGSGNGNDRSGNDDENDDDDDNTDNDTTRTKPTRWSVWSLLLPPKPRDNNQHRDLLLALLSFTFLLLGSLILATSRTLPSFIAGLVVLALGTGYSSLIRSLMSCYVPSAEHTSRLFSLTGMVETLGGVYSSPMLAGLFAVGMKLDGHGHGHGHGGGGGDGGEEGGRGGGKGKGKGFWIGLPYYGVAVFMVLCIVLLMFLRLPRPAREPQSRDMNNDGRRRRSSSSEEADAEEC